MAFQAAFTEKGQIGVRASFKFNDRPGGLRVVMCGLGSGKAIVSTLRWDCERELATPPWDSSCDIVEGVSQRQLTKLFKDDVSGPMAAYGVQTVNVKITVRDREGSITKMTMCTGVEGRRGIAGLAQRMCAVVCH